MTPLSLRRLCACLAGALLLAAPLHAAAHADEASTASSALSLVPVAVLVAAPAALLVGGSMLTVDAVETTARGSVWVLERASDGARASVAVAAGTSVVVGAGLSVVAVGTGQLLCAGSRVVAFIPNEIGASLLYNEQVTR